MIGLIWVSKVDAKCNFKYNSIYDVNAHVLFDTGATHSFVSFIFARGSGLLSLSLDYQHSVSIPLGKVMILIMIRKSCELRIGIE